MTCKRRKHFKKIPPRTYTLSWYQKPGYIASPQVQSGYITRAYTSSNNEWQLMIKKITTRSKLHDIRIGDLTQYIPKGF